MTADGSADRLNIGMVIAAARVVPILMVDPAAPLSNSRCAVPPSGK